ncbi:hypothetical protein ACVNPS_09275 [Candidatus Bipolaricaulota sp. J31]
MPRAKRAPVEELFPPQGQWTEEDYFSLPETNRYLELSEGKLIMPPILLGAIKRRLSVWRSGCTNLWRNGALE